MEQNCGNCEYALVGKFDVVCRRFPPTKVLDCIQYNSDVIYQKCFYQDARPIALLDDWCGEWKERNDANT